MDGWQPPPDWLRVRTLDAHTAGEPLRIITDGVPPIPGTSVVEQRRYAQRHHDALRRMLMWEPRGHADMYGAILTAPTTPDGHSGVLFLHNEGFSTMCGHGVIALATVGMTAGLFGSPDLTELRLDTPAGRVTARPHRKEGQITGASFVNVPSFVLHQDAVVSVAGVGPVRCDVAYGGAFYAYVDAAAVDLELVPPAVDRIIELGRRITHAVTEALDIAHPTGDPELGFLYGTIFVGPAGGAAAHSRNVCVFAEGEVDRSPTGTGVSGRLAIHHARGELSENDTIVVESLLGTTFRGRIVTTTHVGGLPAIVPEISGSAWLTGRHEFVVDPQDPLAEGFLLR